MALGYLDDSKLYAIASAIRSKTSKSAAMTVDEMPEEIESITTGAVVEPLNVTENGTYTAPAGQGYTPVTVSVPQTGITADQIAERKISGAIAGDAAFVALYAFYNQSNITAVSFPSASTVADYAFYGCSNLTEVSFLSADKLGSYAFTGCTKLPTASFPSVATIGSYAFSGCASMSTAYFSSVESIYQYAFSKCRRLIELHLEGVSSVPTLNGAGHFASTPIGGYSATAGQYGSVFVPASLYSAFLTAANWSSISSRIVSVP